MFLFFLQTDTLGYLFWPAKLLTNPFLNTERSGCAKALLLQAVGGWQPELLPGQHSESVSMATNNSIRKTFKRADGNKNRQQ